MNWRAASLFWEVDGITLYQGPGMAATPAGPAIIGATPTLPEILLSSGVIL